jgi:stress-induced-phosphoprotein 1
VHTQIDVPRQSHSVAAHHSFFKSPCPPPPLPRLHLLHLLHLLILSHKKCTSFDLFHHDPIFIIIQCIEAKPDWPKGYNRKGCALHALKQYDEAVAVFEEGLKIAPGSALLTGPMKEAIAARDNAAAGGGAGGMPNPFGPDMWQKLQSHPTTAQWMMDPSYIQGLNTLQQNPQMLQNPQMIQQLGDQRLLQTFLFLMGMPLDLGQPGGPGGGPAGDSAPASKKAKPEPEPEPEPETEEELAKREIREKGTALKDEGNALFKEKKYEEAIAKYEEAEKADPTLMT